MPIYAYRCEACGFAKDVLQKMQDDVLTVCPSCGQSTFKKQVTAAGFQLKGSGWYVTDFRGGNNKDAAAGTNAGAATSDTGDGTSAAASTADKTSAAAPATSATTPAAATPASTSSSASGSTPSSSGS